MEKDQLGLIFTPILLDKRRTYCILSFEHSPVLPFKQWLIPTPLNK
jgi:hypothetical protein